MKRFLLTKTLLRFTLAGFVFFSLLLAACENPLMTEILEFKTVKYNSNGGSSVPSQNLIKDRKLDKPDDPVKIDFLFVAWFIDNDTFVYEWDFDVAPKRDMTLHAKWKPVKQLAAIEIKSQPETLTYTHTDSLDLSGLVVTLVYDDGTEEDAAFGEFASKGITAAPAHGTALSRSTHNGQPVVVSCGGVTALTENLTVDPKAIVFNVDPIPPQLYAGSPLTPALTVRDGETILAPETDYTVEYSDNASVGIADVTVTGIGNYEGSTGGASFTINLKIFTVTFNADGGTPAPSAQSVGYGYTASEPASAMTRAGYTFGGWFRDANLIVPWSFANDIVYDDITIYAKWNANSGSITLSVEDIVNRTPSMGDITVPVPLSKAGDSTQTITLTGSYSNPQWKVAGVGNSGDATGSGSSFVLKANADEYGTTGGHTLMLTVTIDGNQYMLNIRFTIVE